MSTTLAAIQSLHRRLSRRNLARAAAIAMVFALPPMAAAVTSCFIEIKGTFCGQSGGCFTIPCACLDVIHADGSCPSVAPVPPPPATGRKQTIQFTGNCIYDDYAPGPSGCQLVTTGLWYLAQCEKIDGAICP